MRRQARRRQESIQQIVRAKIQAELRKHGRLSRLGSTATATKIQAAMLKSIEKDKSLPVRILTNLLEGAANQYRCAINVVPIAKE